MKIYTKKGDGGTTSLFGGTKISKFNLRIEAYGTLDELNSWMGILHEGESEVLYKSKIEKIQHELFNIGSWMAADPDKKNLALPELNEKWITRLEAEIDEMEGDLPALSNFVLPGGNQLNAYCHVARCVCRRAERRTVELNSEHSVNSAVIPYLNRLSDWLFVFARSVSLRTGSKEMIWSSKSVD